MAIAPIDWSSVIARLRGAGMTQTEIADACGVSGPSISDLARGTCTNPSYRLGARLLELASAAEVPAAVALTVMEDDSALLEVEGQRAIALTPAEAEMLRVLLNRASQKKARA